MLKNRAPTRFAADGRVTARRSSIGDPKEAARLSRYKKQWRKEWDEERARDEAAEADETTDALDAQLDRLQEGWLEDMTTATRALYDAYAAAADADQEAGRTACNEPASAALIDQPGDEGGDEPGAQAGDEWDGANVPEYREIIFDRLRADMGDGNLLIVGHSLADESLRKMVERAAAIKIKSKLPTEILVLTYTPDEARAALMESKGMTVAFGGIDEFFAEMGRAHEFAREPTLDFEDPLSSAPAIRPMTIDISHAATQQTANLTAMYNGWPATYADISAGLTFERTLAGIIAESTTSAERQHSIILAPSGFGKTTAARQLMLKLRSEGYHVWEHKNDHSFITEEWLKVALFCKSREQRAALFIDDAQIHLFEVNPFLQRLDDNGINNFHVIMTSSINLWRPRVKVPQIFRKGRDFVLKKLNQPEIDKLLNLVDFKPEINQLIDISF